MFALRKSVGAFSAGTHVKIVGMNTRVKLTDPSKEVYTVEADKFMYITKDGNRKLTKVTEQFDVLRSDLVQLRKKSETVSAVARHDRSDRVAKRVVYEMENKTRK